MKVTSTPSLLMAGLAISGASTLAAPINDARSPEVAPKSPRLDASPRFGGNSPRFEGSSPKPEGVDAEGKPLAGFRKRDPAYDPKRLQARQLQGLGLPSELTAGLTNALPLGAVTGLAGALPLGAVTGLAGGLVGGLTGGGQGGLIEGLGLDSLLPPALTSVLDNVLGNLPIVGGLVNESPMHSPPVMNEGGVTGLFGNLPLGTINGLLSKGVSFGQINDLVAQGVPLSTINGLVSNPLATIQQVIGTAGQALPGPLQGVAQTVTNTAGGLVATAQDVAGQVTQGLPLGAVGGAVGQVGNTVQGAVNTVQGAVQGAVGGNGLPLGQLPDLGNVLPGQLPVVGGVLQGQQGLPVVGQLPNVGNLLPGQVGQVVGQLPNVGNLLPGQGLPVVGQLPNVGSLLPTQGLPVVGQLPDVGALLPGQGGLPVVGQLPNVGDLVPGSLGQGLALGAIGKVPAVGSVLPGGALPDVGSVLPGQAGQVLQGTPLAGGVIADPLKQVEGVVGALPTSGLPTSGLPIVGDGSALPVDPTAALAGATAPITSGLPVLDIAGTAGQVVGDLPVPSGVVPPAKRQLAGTPVAATPVSQVYDPATNVLPPGFGGVPMAPSPPVQAPGALPLDPNADYKYIPPTFSSPGGFEKVLPSNDNPWAGVGDASGRPPNVVPAPGYLYPGASIPGLVQGGIPGSSTVTDKIPYTVPGAVSGIPAQAGIPASPPFPNSPFLPIAGEPIAAYATNDNKVTLPVATVNSLLGGLGGLIGTAPSTGNPLIQIGTAPAGTPVQQIVAGAQPDPSDLKAVESAIVWAGSDLPVPTPSASLPVSMGLPVPTGAVPPPNTPKLGNGSGGLIGGIIDGLIGSASAGIPNEGAPVSAMSSASASESASASASEASATPSASASGIAKRGHEMKNRKWRF